MGKSAISYLDYVWNCVTGCSGKSCQAHCYAREIVKRFPAIHCTGDMLNMCPPFHEVVFHEDRLNDPLHWRKPRVVGAGFFGDLFDEQVKFGWIDQIVSVMQDTKHTYILLTKQPQNLVKWYQQTNAIGGGDWSHNIWWGTTVCTQAEADERIPKLLKVPGKKWLSMEPMLGPVDLLKAGGLWESRRGGVAYTTESWRLLNCVILGGESGPKARPMHPDWVRSVRDQCAVAGVPFVFKQWGEWVDYHDQDGSGEPTWTPKAKWLHSRRAQYVTPDGIRDGVARAGSARMVRVGTKAAGRTLDGRIHNDLPWRTA